jgi:hypothetical protein
MLYRLTCVTAEFRVMPMNCYLHGQCSHAILFSSITVPVHIVFCTVNNFFCTCNLDTSVLKYYGHHSFMLHSHADCMNLH